MVYHWITLFSKGCIYHWFTMKQPKFFVKIGCMMGYHWIEWISSICFHSNPGWPEWWWNLQQKKGWHQDILLYIYIYTQISNRCNAFTQEHGGCKRPRIGDLKSINCGFTMIYRRKIVCHLIWWARHEDLWDGGNLALSVLVVFVGSRCLWPEIASTPLSSWSLGSSWVVQIPGFSSTWMSIEGSILPSGYVKIAIENGDLQWIFPLNMIIFNSYVKLPEGSCHWVKIHGTTMMTPLPQNASRGQDCRATRMFDVKKTNGFLDFSL